MATRVVYAVAVAALGVLLVSATFAFIWAELPPWMPWPQAIFRATGAVMLVAAVGLVPRRTAAASGAILTGVFAAWLLLLQLPQIIDSPAEELLWSGAGQLVTLAASAAMVVASVRAHDRGVRIARVVYAAALPLLGLHHFLAAGATGAVPAWLPFPAAWVYATGAAHMAAGVAIVVGVVPRLAATLEAIMITAFVVLVHLPGVIGDPRDPMQWTMFVAAAAIGGAAWVVARSYGPARGATAG